MTQLAIIDVLRNKRSSVERAAPALSHTPTSKCYIYMCTGEGWPAARPGAAGGGQAGRRARRTPSLRAAREGALPQRIKATNKR